MKKIWKRTWIYKLYDVIQTHKEYRKDKTILFPILHGNDFKMLLKTYLGIDSKIDWIGRVYGVANPNINNNGEFDISNTIIELDGINTNSDAYVNNWLYRQLYVLREVFHLKTLYDYIDVEIKHVGPISQDNYLVVFDIISRQEYAKAFKKFFKSSIFNIIIFSIIILTLILWI